MILYKLFKLCRWRRSNYQIAITKQDGTRMKDNENVEFLETEYKQSSKLQHGGRMLQKGRWGIKVKEQMNEDEQDRGGGREEPTLTLKIMLQVPGACSRILKT